MVESSCKVTHLSTSVPVHAGSTGSSSSYVYGSVNVVFSTITRTLPRLLSLPSATSAHTVVGIRLSAMTSARKSETMRFFICCFLLVIFSARYINAFRPCCPVLVQEEEVGEARLGLSHPYGKLTVSVQTAKAWQK